MARETLSFDAGELISLPRLADWIVSIPDIDGVTFSGGEPMAQAGPLADLVDLVRRRRNLSFMSYSGFTFEELNRRPDGGIQRLLERLDILVDGAYLPERHTDLIWRGSDNQRVLLLSDRHRDLEDHLDERGVFVEIHEVDASIRLVGILPRGFRAFFESTLNDAKAGSVVGERHGPKEDPS